VLPALGLQVVRECGFTGPVRARDYRQDGHAASSGMGRQFPEDSVVFA
jgi:hypothetical protein